jgi:hypothetical protein
MQTCPACQRDVQENAKECPYCGVVFEKWKSLHSNSALHPLAKDSPGTRPPGTHIWLIPAILGCGLSGFFILKMIGSPALMAELAKEEWAGGLVLCIWGAVGGIGLFLYGLNKYRLKRLIGNVSTSTIGSLIVGRFVQIAGTAQPDGPLLRAPFSGKPCVWFSYKVETEGGMSKDSKLLVSHKPNEFFFVSDITGTIRVLPSLTTDLKLKNDRTFKRYFKKLPPEVIAQLNKPISNFDTLRCRESFVPPGKTVYVLGTVRESSKANPDGTARLFISNGLKGANQVFQLSDRSVSDLLSHWSWQRFALIFYGGAIITVAFLYAILQWYAKPGP